ncbi:MAG TPA: YIP1 family protein [Chloroflexia bacterium]|jgi:hypothetical protein
MSKLQQWLRQLWDSYRSAVIRPDPAKFEIAARRANWPSVWFGLLIVALACAIEHVALAWQYDWYFQDFDAMLRALNLDPAPVAAIRELAFWGGPLRGFLTPFLTFFLGALFLMWMSRRFDGRGRAGSFKENFLIHCYLLSLVYTPLRTLIALLAIIPFLGSFVGILVYFYHLYCAGVTLQVSHGLDRAKAQWAVWIPQAVYYLVTIALSTIVVIYFVFTSFVTVLERILDPR